MSTLIEKNMPHPWLAGSSHPFLAAAVHLQDNAPIAEIARLNYKSAFSCVLSFFAFTVDLLQTIAVGIQKTR